MRDAATIVRGESGQSPQSHQRSNLECGVQAETNKQEVTLFHLRFRKLPMAPGMRCRTGFRSLQHFQPKRQMAEETIPMKAIVVTDQAAGTAGMKLVERPEPPAAINDVIIQIHASGFVPTEL